MPYYLYRISTPDAIDLVKNLELVDQFDSFKEAKTITKKLRTEQDGQSYSYKIMFAENQLLAEERLLEKRERPVLMEFER